MNMAPLGMPADAGHEEITRQALLLAGELDPESRKILDAAAVESITLGNYATDLPNGPYPVSLNVYWGFPAGTDWNNPVGQHLHFLRDYVDSTTLASAYDVCKSARESIARVSRDAEKMWQTADHEKSLFLLGHATHIIQDSFSPAHAIRGAKEQNNDIQDVCYYPDGAGPETSAEEICFHKAVDPRDRIWLEKWDADELARSQHEWGESGDGVTPVDNLSEFDLNDETEASRRSHLKHEARLARIATAKYIDLILTDIRKRGQDENYDVDYQLLNERLTKQLFEGGADLPVIGKVMPSGVMRCEGLSKNQVRLDRKTAMPRVPISPDLVNPSW